MKNIYILITIICLNLSAQWQGDVRLTNNPDISRTTLNNAWCIAANGTIVHAVWQESGSGNNGIYYKRSTDGGITWLPENRLTFSSGYSPCISVLGNYINIAWDDFRDGHFEIYYKRSTDAGLTWEQDKRLTNNPSSKYGPSVSSYGDIVNIVWDDERNGNRDIYYKRSTDKGITWQADTRLTNTYHTANPSIASNSSTISICWQDNRHGSYQVYYKRSSNAGLNWSPDMRISNTTAFSGNPSIAISGSSVYVFWNDMRDGNFEIYNRKSSNGGLSWGTENRLTNNSAESEFPSVFVSLSNVHIVWSENRDGNQEIYYKSSSDAGINWIVDTRLTNNNSSSESPSLAVSGSMVHVIWSDFRDYNNEIYFKRNPSGNAIGIILISNGVPNKYELYQNYPNPFNPKTVIRFDIPYLTRRGAGVVVLKVYDILGRDIATIVNKQLQPGSYEVDWDASNYSSGIYYYTLSAGDPFYEPSGSKNRWSAPLMITKKMILIK